MHFLQINFSASSFLVVSSQRKYLKHKLLRIVENHFLHCAVNVAAILSVMVSCDMCSTFLASHPNPEGERMGYQSSSAMNTDTIESTYVFYRIDHILWTYFLPVNNDINVLSL